ncbi:MAG: hypothetical protein GF381_01935 [Candidatus Pacebacteria bacterium]|nr:hypothetical protein [Candidatus Paceibacterota bacterium]
MANQIDVARPTCFSSCSDSGQTGPILLVDINSYFATLLQQENPKLRGKPLAVVKDLGRTCVIAASKEAKKLGVKTGSNLFQAKRCAPNLIEVEAEFELYLSATKRLKKLFETISPDVIVYSLDEAFIDLSHCRKHLYSDRSVGQVGQQIQEQIKAELGSWVTSNVGIGPNRFLAKMAAEISPKGAVFEINSDNLDPVLASVEFEDVCGIGRRLAKKLSMINVHHPYQIRFFSETDLDPIFGPFWTQELFKMAYGHEPHHLALLDQPLSQMKSVSRSITLWKLTDDQALIKRILYNLTREVVYKARKMNLMGRRVGLILSGSDQFQSLGWRSHLTFKHHLNHTQEVFEVIWDRLYQSWSKNFKPIKLRVSLSLLEPADHLTRPLLPSWHKQEAIETALDQLSARYGLFAVKSGLLAEGEAIRPEVTGFFGDKQYQLV